MSKSEIIRFLILRTIGNFLVLFAVFGVLATFGPSLYYEVQFRVVQARGVNFQVYEPKPSLFGEIIKKEKQGQGPSFGDVLTGSKDQILIPEDTEFSIVIPRLGANKKVFPNVDSSNKKEFLPILQKGVAHAKGTVFPGMRGNIYLFAHSTDNFWDVGRYNAIFYLLKDLREGDEIVIFFQNKRHNYIVSEKKVVDEKEISYITQAQGGPETLVLQTCWPPGTTWKRLIVLARPK